MLLPLAVEEQFPIIKSSILYLLAALSTVHSVSNNSLHIFNRMYIQRLSKLELNYTVIFTQTLKL